MAYDKIATPTGDAITINENGVLNVPDRPVITFIEGDGIGPDITKASMHIWNSAIKKAYGSKCEIDWLEVYAGEKANAVYGPNTWLPEETLDAISKYRVSIKGPLTTPVGKGFRSLNVTLRQKLDLYVCLRPVRHFPGVPSPVKSPEKTDTAVAADTSATRESSMPDSYFNYAAQLLEQMRGVYSTSWDSCSNGSTWHGGHNHFYNPCSGADVPPSHQCPTYDCTKTCGCLNPPPQPVPHPPVHDHTCSGGTTTYYDDCAYKLQKICDQLNRIETMTNEMYSTNQQLFSYLIEYYNTVMMNSKK